MMREEIAKESHKLYSNKAMIQKYMKEYDVDGYKNRILLIDVNCIEGSTGKIVYDLYNGIRANRRKAAICYGRGPLVEGEDIYKFGIDTETKIHAGLARITGYNGYFSPQSTKRVIKYIEEFKPDIIHIHELHAYFVNIKPLIEYIKKKGIPVIWTFHCEYMYTGKCGYAYECSNFQTECHNCPAVKDYPKSMFFDKTKQMFRMKKKLLEDMDFTIVTPSQWLADRVRLSFLNEKNIKVIHNGVDTSIFKPVDSFVLRKQLIIPDANKVVLFVAPIVLDKRKGGHWVIRIAEMMKNENVSFVLVGGGEKPENVPSNVIFAGTVYDKNLLAQYYSLADVFLLCSEKETYSMTCAEALCCGTRVIGFKAGAPETVFEKPNAVFFKYGDINALINGIKSI